MEITAIGIDLAKNVFQLHAVDRAGRPIIRKKLNRSHILSFLANLQPSLIGMEACGSANYWAREIKKLGHEVKLIAPQFVKPFVKSNKNDAADAEAICEAVQRPHMRFVSPKSIEQQDIQSLHRVRSRRVAARTALANEMRGLLSEYGLILPVGIQNLRKELSGLLDKARQEEKITPIGFDSFTLLLDELRDLDKKILSIEQKIDLIHRQSEVSQRLVSVPGVGKITSTAIVSAVGDAKVFKNGREFAAFLGLVPRQHSSGGKDRLLGISKRGDVYIRTLLIHGARASIRFLEKQPESASKRWLNELIQRRGKNRAIVALANKNARRIWALLAHNEEYKAA